MADTAVSRQQVSTVAPSLVCVVVRPTPRVLTAKVRGLNLRGSICACLVEMLCVPEVGTALAFWSAGTNFVELHENSVRSPDSRPRRRIAGKQTTAMGE